jgi:hypothetical protein
VIENLLAARVKITSYNHHCSAPFYRALVVYRCQVYSVKGADAVIQSARMIPNTQWDRGIFEGRIR